MRNEGTAGGEVFLVYEKKTSPFAGGNRLNATKRDLEKKKEKEAVV